VKRKWFFEKEIRTGINEVVSFLFPAYADYESAWTLNPQHLGKFHSGHPRHVAVRNNDIEALCLQKFQGRFSVITASHLNVIHHQQILEDADDGKVVIDYKS
jgi:hypothetical protein